VIISAELRSAQRWRQACPLANYLQLPVSPHVLICPELLLPYNAPAVPTTTLGPPDSMAARADADSTASFGVVPPRADTDFVNVCAAIYTPPR
jgi:hypothetical protein